MIGVFYAVALARAHVCYSDQPEENRAAHCAQVGDFCSGTACKSWSEFSEGVPNDQVSIIFSQDTDFNYDDAMKLMKNNYYGLKVYARPFVPSQDPPVQEAKVMESASEITLTLMTSIVKADRNLKTVDFDGFTHIKIMNAVSTQKNILALYRYPESISLSQVQTIFVSSDTRPVELVCEQPMSGHVTLSDYKSDVWNIVKVPRCENVHLPNIQTLIGRSLHLSARNVHLWEKVSDNEKVEIMLCNDGIRITQGIAWFMLAGSFEQLQCSGIHVDLICQDGFRSVFGYMADTSPYLIQSSAITITGDNWPESVTGNPHISSPSTKLDCNAFPCSIEHVQSIVMMRSDVYVYKISGDYYNGLQISRDGVEGTANLRCGSMWYNENAPFQLDGVSLSIDTMDVDDGEDIDEMLAFADSKGITIGRISGSFDTIDAQPGQTIVVECECLYSYDEESLALPDELFTDCNDKVKLRKDVNDAVTHFHNVLPNIAETFSFVNAPKPITIKSWTAGQKHTLELRTADSCPFACAYVDEFVIAVSQDPTKAFTSTEWDVKLVNDPWIENGALEKITKVGDSAAAGEPVYGTGKLKYKYTRIPTSAVDIIMYTDEKWATTLSGFGKFIRILTPNDLNGMEKRISPNSKNILLIVTESVPSGKSIDLSGLKSDANLFVVGMPVNQLVDMCNDNETFCDQVMNLVGAMQNNVDIEKLVDFAKKNDLMSLTPSVRVNVGKLNSLVTGWVDYISGVQCTNLFGFMSKFSLVGMFKVEHAYYDFVTYKTTRGRTCKTLTLVPVDVETGTAAFVDKVTFSDSEWEIRFSCGSIPAACSSVCPSTMLPFSQTVKTSKVTDELGIVSFSKNLEYNYKSGTEIRGIKIYAGFDDIVCKLFPSIPLLEDAKSSTKSSTFTNKLKNLVSTAVITEVDDEENLGESDVALTFTGDWSKVTKINGMLCIIAGRSEVTVTNAVKVTAEALSFANAKLATIQTASGVTNLKFANAQYLSEDAKYSIQGVANVEFAEIHAHLLERSHSRSISVDNMDNIIADKITCTDYIRMYIPKATVKKSISVGPSVHLSIGEGSVSNDCDLELKYTLVDAPVFTVPDFRPKSIKITYAGDRRDLVIKDHINTRYDLKYFLLPGPCATWKTIAETTLPEEEHTVNGEVFKVKLACANAGDRTSLRLSFELTDKIIDIPETPATPEGEGEGEGEGNNDKEEEVLLPPNQVIESADFPGGKVTITVENDGSTTENKVTFTETVVDSNTKVTVEATLVLSKSLVMTGDSAIVAGASGAIEFEPTCEVKIVSSGASLPSIDVGFQKANAAVPKVLAISLDLQGISEDEVKEAFGDEGKVLVSGYNLDCDKWIASISLDVVGDFKFVVKCREADSGKLLADAKKEVYVTLDDGLPGGAIAGIVIGCVIVAAAIGFVVWHFLFRSKPSDSSDNNDDIFKL